MNLVSNAAYAIRDGHRANGVLTLQTRADERGVTVRVKDNGIGIPAESLLKIFNNGFTTRQEGHGFGLHSSAIAARSMGGELRAESPGPGEGATFHLRIPRRAKTALNVQVEKHAA